MTVYFLCLEDFCEVKNEKKKSVKSKVMKTSQFSHIKSVNSLTPQSFMGYSMTQKHLNKYKKEQDSDKESVISGLSNKGRRMKLRQVSEIKNFVLDKSKKCTISN